MNEAAEIMNLYKELIVSEKYTFPLKGKVNVSRKLGVYIIYDTNGSVLHVGMTPSGKGGLNQRLYNHITKNSVLHRERLKPYNIELRGKCQFQIMEVSHPRKRALLEALTAGLLCPVHFGTGKKKTSK